MKSLKKTYTINAPLRLVWQSLIDSKKICEWGAGPAVMDGNIGTEFSLWGGDIHGVNTNIVQEKLLEQDWISGSWKSPSKVVFTLHVVSDKSTNVTLVHSLIPDEEFDDIKEGWDSYYMGPLANFAERK